MPGKDQNFWKAIRRFFFRIYLRSGWLDVLYPLLLSIGIFTSLTYLIYNGQKHRRIAALIEESLIEFSLRIAGPKKILVPGQIATVSFRKADLKNFNTQNNTHFADPSVEVYGELIEKIASMSPQRIILSWMPHWHQKDDDYTYFLHALALAEKKMNAKIILATPPQKIGEIPLSVLNKVQLLEADPCEMKTQIICSYNPKWQSWIIQYLANTLLTVDETAYKHVFVTNLPRLHPSFLVQLSSQSSLQDISFTDILKVEKGSTALKNKIVFIGNSLMQNMALPFSNSEEVGWVRINGATSKNANSAPFHKFWALIAQAFIDGDLPEVAGVNTTYVFTGVFTLLMLGILFFMGVPFSLIFFLLVTVLAPIVNGFALRYFRFYLPLFNILYCGFGAVIIGTFLRLALESFISWRLHMVQEFDARAFDLKSNFLSLISHNLNTPLAKIQGILKLLGECPPKNAKVSELCKDANKDATIMQLCIRYTLQLAALEDNLWFSEPMTILALKTAIEEENSPILTKLGINMGVDLPEGTLEKDLGMLPFHLDKKVFLLVIYALAWLLRSESISLQLAEGQESVEGEITRCLRFVFHALQIPEELGTWFKHYFALKESPPCESEDLLSELALSFLAKTLKQMQSSVHVDGSTLVVELLV